MKCAQRTQAELSRPLFENTIMATLIPHIETSRIIAIGPRFAEAALRQPDSLPDDAPAAFVESAALQAEAVCAVRNAIATCWRWERYKATGVDVGADAAAAWAAGPVYESAKVETMPVGKRAPAKQKATSA